MTICPPDAAGPALACACDDWSCEPPDPTKPVVVVMRVVKEDVVVAALDLARAVVEVVYCRLLPGTVWDASGRWTFSDLGVGSNPITDAVWGVQFPNGMSTAIPEIPGMRSLDALRPRNARPAAMSTFSILPKGPIPSDIFPHSIFDSAS